MAIQIQFRRGLATEWSGTNPKLALAEMGIETDTNLFKIGDGNNFWNDLPYGGVQGDQGTTGYVGSVGFVETDNVLYVAKNGNDSYAGTSLQYPKLTIRSALESATRGTTIFVKSGDYTEDNPLTVPDFVSLWGDGLRAVTVRPLAPNQNLFYVNNGSYITNMTFKDHVYPAAVVSFNPDGSAGVITTSPYVQNCTSMSTTGTGMRVDGNYAEGLKSMVVDSFTQYNQNGIGIHLLNRGYAQLVSVFTICCDKGFLCETGGSCSITNSNSSFGNYAFYSDGVSPVLYTGRTTSARSGRTFILDNLVVKPSVGDAVDFGDGNYYAVASSTPFKPGNTTITYPTSSSLWAQQSATYRNARQTVLDSKSLLQVKTIKYVLETYPGFDFNQAKCSRDVGTILECVCYDLVLGSNFQSVKAGTSYYRAVSSTVTGSQKTQTLSAITYLKDQTLLLVQSVPTAYTRLSDSFDIILNIFDNGAEAAPALTYTPPTGADNYTGYAVGILQANKTFIAEETVAYINSFTYDQSKCYRDTGLIVDSVAFDVLHGGTSQSAFAGLQYWNQSGYTGDIERELTTTTAAITYVRDQVVAIVSATSGVSIANTVTSNFNILLDILTNGTAAVTDTIIPNTAATTSTSTIAAYNAIVSNKTTVINNTIDWITSNYPGFGYNQPKCYRDTGLIVDSLAFDLLYDGTSQSTFAGLQYWNHNGYTGNIATEITTTTNAIRYLSTLTSNIALANGGVGAQLAIRSKFDILLSTLADLTNVTDNIVPNGSSSTNATIINTYNAILSNKSSLQTQIISWINSNNPTFTYNTSTCSRDVGYIIDSIAFDYLHGGNRQSIMSAVYYYSFNASSEAIAAAQIPQTTAAYDYIKTIAGNVIQGIPVATRYQSTITQTITINTATSVETALLVTKVNTITNIIVNGPTVATARVPISLNPVNDSNLRNAFTLLLANKTFIQTETLAYINSIYGYNQATCRRDVGYILDSVAFDLLHGGNRQSVMSGVYYYGFSTSTSVIATEIPQTTAAYDFIRSISADIVTGNVIASPYQNTVTQIVSVNTATKVEIGLITAKISTITNIILNGPLVAPSRVPIGLVANTSTTIVNAFNLLLANRTFIQEETIAYINAMYIGLTYSTSTCKRDVGYIIDAISYDITYGGNSQTVNAADSYYDGNYLQIAGSEKLATVSAYKFIKDIVDEVVVNTVVTPRSQATQITNLTPARESEALILQSLLNIIANVVSNAYSSTITLDTSVPFIVNDKTIINFHQYSLISASSHSFEWIGAGTNINAALPYLGGEPNTDNYAVEVSGGKVNFTGTDQRGDFRIGNDLVINRNLGTISGRTFTKSLFAVMTPYILAIGG